MSCTEDTHFRGFKDVEPLSAIDRLFVEYDYASENTTPADFAPYLKNPEFVFDHFFLHKRHAHSKDHRTIIHAFATIQYYFDYIKTHLDEVRFELDNYEFITKMNYGQFLPAMWRSTYTFFIDRINVSPDQLIRPNGPSGNPNEGGTANRVNEEGI